MLLRSRALGSYTMSDYSVWSGSEVADEIRRFGNEVSGTNGDVGTNRNALISAGSDGTRFWNDWQIFMRDWASYQSERSRVGSPLFGTSSTSAIVALRALVDRYNTLEQRFRSLTGVTATARSGDSRPGAWMANLPGGPGGSLVLLVAGGIGVVALIATAVIATQARAITSPLRRNRRRKRR